MEIQPRNRWLVLNRQTQAGSHFSTRQKAEEWIDNIVNSCVSTEDPSKDALDRRKSLLKQAYTIKRVRVIGLR